MQNLTIVAGKRGENRKVKSDDVAMMEEMAHVTDNTKDAKEDITFQEQTSPTKASSNSLEDDPEKMAILEALSAQGYEVNEDAVNTDREATNKILAREQPVGDSASILCFPLRDFSRVLELFLEVKKIEERKVTSSKRHKPETKSKKLLGLPIIIIPSAMTSPITMINALDFFQKATFVPRDVKIKKMGRNKLPSITVERYVSSRCGGGKLTFEIIDNPTTKLRHAHEWDRVVAIIPQGAEWQFKGWRYTRPVDIFNRSFGYYIGIENAPVPKDVLKWNVKLGYLNRDKRGLDSVAYASFWNSLDEWMAVHKPEYLLKDN